MNNLDSLGEELQNACGRYRIAIPATARLHSQPTEFQFNSPRSTLLDVDEPRADASTDLAQHLAELMQISRDLADASPSERIVLRQRRQEIRSLHAPSLETVTTERLLSREIHLELQIRRATAARFDIATAGAGSGEGGGLDALQTMEHNRRMDLEFGRADLVQELNDIRRELSTRNHS